MTDFLEAFGRPSTNEKVQKAQFQIRETIFDLFDATSKSVVFCV